MINVDIKKKNNQITSIIIKGHALSNDYGKDLVCAGVSTACFGICNALDYYHFDGDIIVNEGYLEIKIYNTNEQIETVLETFKIILCTIEQSYNKYIKIKESEV